MDKDILIADEAAQILRVDRQRLYELCRTKQIPFILLGQRQYRFSRLKLERWLENGGSQQTKENESK
jgi:excisionase family DNA binding protein